MQGTDVLLPSTMHLAATRKVRAPGCMQCCRVMGLKTRYRFCSSGRQLGSHLTLLRKSSHEGQL
eukprot:2758014-Prorocentrum_lima.AAC.1